MIKAVFFDLDRTLLSSKKEILPSSQSALRACRDKGVKLFIATGRPPRLDKMLGWTDNEFDLFDGGIYYNGGCRIIGNTVHYTYLPSCIVSHCIKAAAEYENLNIALQMKDDIHSFNNPLEAFAYRAWGIDESSIAALTEECEHQTVKILIYYKNLIDTDKILPKALVEDLKEYCKADARFYLTDEGQVIQITADAANKFDGIEVIRKKLGLQKSEIAVFGDDVNDMEMLSGYENSVAMGNADELVKGYAKFVTKDNDSGGIAYALKELLHLI